MEIFNRRRSPAEIRLRGSAGSYGYLLFSWGVETAIFFQQIAKSRSGCMVAQAYMDIHLDIR